MAGTHRPSSAAKPQLSQPCNSPPRRESNGNPANLTRSCPSGGSTAASEGPRLRAAWRSPAAAVAAVAVMWLTGYMLGQSYPRSVLLRPVDTEAGSLGVVPGTGSGSQATLGPAAIPPGKLPDSDSVRALLLLGAPLRVSARAGTPPSGLASLVSIYDHRQRGIILLGPDRDDLVFLCPTRSASLTFDQPALRVPDALEGVRRGDTLRVEVWRRNDGYCLSTAHSTTCGLGFQVDSGWSVLLPAEWFPDWLDSLLDFAWLALMGFPAGLWARGALNVALTGSLVTAGICLVPVRTILLPWGPFEFVAAGLGFAVGLGLVRWVSASPGDASGDES